MSASPTRWPLVVAAIAGAAGVVIGAFGAHGLPEFLSDQGVDAETVARRLDQFDTGARYHLVHAVAVLALAVSPLHSRRLGAVVTILFTLGILFFSGSLYLLVLTNTPVLGAVTPIGGVLWIVAWSLLAFASSEMKSSEDAPSRM